MDPIPVSALVPPEEIHRVTIEEYRGLADNARWVGAHVELIDGLIVDMSPRTSLHENAVEWLSKWLHDVLRSDALRVRTTLSLTLGRSEPEPDIAVTDSPLSILTHPTTALLVIEVAVSSQTRDLKTKPAVYAPMVTEYWVVDLDHGVVITHRDSDGAGYGDVTIHPRGAKLTPVAVPSGELDTEALFAYAFAEHERDL